MDNKNQLIDLDAVIARRNKKLDFWLPKFVKSRLKKIIHQNDVNEIITLFGHNEGIDFVNDILKHLRITTETIGAEKVLAAGLDKKFVFVSNHPLGGLDGLAIISSVFSYFGKTKAVINDILLNIYSLKPVFHGVNVFGHTTKQQIAALDELYTSDSQIIVFPAGLVSRKYGNVVTDTPWKKSFLTKAIQHKRDIVPVYISGRNSRFFYNFAKIRKLIGIKLNIELVLLPAEVFKYKGNTITITFGNVIPVTTFSQEKPVEDWVAYIREKVYQLAKK